MADNFIMFTDVTKAFRDNFSLFAYSMHAVHPAKDNTFSITFIPDKEEPHKTIAKISYFLATLDMKYKVKLIHIIYVLNEMSIFISLESREEK